MTEEHVKPFVSDAEDKLTPVMIYTLHSLTWGKVVSRPAIRVNIWLRTEMAPKYFHLKDAQVMMVGAGKNFNPHKFNDLYVQTERVCAFHTLPPTDEPMDYEPDEPNRVMLPTAAVAGHFHFDGHLRMSEQTDIDNFLNATKGDFLPFYDAKMTCPVQPNLTGISAPLVLIRQDVAMFSPHS